MYSFDGRVRYSECDGSGRLSLVGAMNYLQDCSTFHSESVGLGLGYLAEQGLAWVLAAWQIEIDELPRFGTHVTVSTWCYEMTRTQALRNFQIVDDEGRSLVRADSHWAVFDTRARRAVRVPEDQRAYVSGEPRLEMAPFERKIRVEGEGRATSPITVGTQNLDTNGHVNNAQYVLFALEALADAGVEAPRGCLSVQYRAQAHLGDTVVPLVHGDAGDVVVELGSPEGATFALARFRARP